MTKELAEFDGCLDPSRRGLSGLVGLAGATRNRQHGRAAQCCGAGDGRAETGAGGGELPGHGRRATAARPGPIG